MINSRKIYGVINALCSCKAYILKDEKSIRDEIFLNTIKESAEGLAKINATDFFVLTKLDSDGYLILIKITSGKYTKQFFLDYDFSNISEEVLKVLSITDFLVLLQEQIRQESFEEKLVIDLLDAIICGLFEFMKVSSKNPKSSLRIEKVHEAYLKGIY